MPGLRVLFVSEDIGGHRTMHAHLERALADCDDVDATFVRLREAGPVRRGLGASVPGLGRLDLDFRPARAIVAAAALARQQVRPLVEQADVVHWYTHNAALVATDLVRLRPAVVSLDMTNAQNAERLPYRSPTRYTWATARPLLSLERRVYAAARLVLAKSEFAARSVRDDYGVPAAKVAVQPFGILACPPPVRTRPLDRPRLVFVGTTLTRKGGQQLLDLWQRELRDRCDLTLVTKERVDPMPGLTVRNDIEHGDGRLDDVLANATALVHPSDMDASPHAVFEGMAAALPVIVADAGGMPEQVVAGETGYVVAPHDDDALRDAITRLLDDPAKAEAMGAAGRTLLDQRFDMRVTVPQLIERLLFVR